MTADQHIAHAAARAAVAYRNGDDLLGDYWTERCTRLSDKRELDAINEARTRDAIARLERCPTFDELKGSPDHSGLTATEHAHIHSDAYTDALGPRLRRG